MPSPPQKNRVLPGPWQRHVGEAGRDGHRRVGNRRIRHRAIGHRRVRDGRVGLEGVSARGVGSGSPVRRGARVGLFVDTEAVDPGDRETPRSVDEPDRERDDTDPWTKVARCTHRANIRALGGLAQAASAKYVGRAPAGGARATAEGAPRTPRSGRVFPSARTTGRPHARRPCARAGRTRRQGGARLRRRSGRPRSRPRTG